MDDDDVLEDTGVIAEPISVFSEVTGYMSRCLIEMYQ